MSSAFDDFELKGHKLDNRFVVAPMTRTSADSKGKPTELMGDYYARFAEGGWPLIISEGVYTDRQASQGYVNQPGITDAPQTDAWKQVVERVHKHGAKFIMQLMHAGAQFQHNEYTDTPIAPSEVKPKGEPLALYGESDGWKPPKAMDESDFDAVMQGFVGSVNRAEEAGFDGVELHAANGYLLNEFLSEHFNQRGDQWGGDIGHRLKFVAMVAKACKDAAKGENFIVGIRLGQITVTDPDYQWPEGEDAMIKIVKALKEAGIDYIHTTDTDVSRKPFKGGSNKTLAEIVQEFSDIPLIVNGGIDESNYEHIAAHYPNALLALGKKALANPDMPKRLKDGETIEDLEFAMLQPTATLENEWQWRDEHDKHIEAD
ncbi:2,4-dienoyl-CoA reductase-like NADH-dependent reductase (Old Yellow Enzyme family) [Idiomarina aquatica]|uniref:2,4-dienoyl-CoA reductase-like NADH-dependent reductase (Old Yellow Enzyme family) n=1 Tax=Idiomarina aquatica TaxID=1327752 RepID=A0A4R6P0M3_9GAMM|nr:NADH:flavin oxidoreductase [Idiomarina aquatica]TDP30961.1 2,4-dienoyl-CoA reductase-like NADH-dependent reductase (Old Yellow Enzyme family) [Idiomarina aquatica]